MPAGVTRGAMTVNNYINAPQVSPDQTADTITRKLRSAQMGGGF